MKVNKEKEIYRPFLLHQRYIHPILCPFDKIDVREIVYHEYDAPCIRRREFIEGTGR